MPVDPTAFSPTPLRSMEHERNPLTFGRIYGGGVVVLQGSRRLSSTPAASSLTPATELPYLGGHGAPRPPHPLPLPLSQAQCRWHW